jgi:pimeloyl-ACP methyl ester carboxylesterase
MFKQSAALCRTLLALVLLTTLALVGLAAIGELLSHPAHRPVGDPPPDLAATAVTFPSSSGRSVSGWQIHGTGNGAVLLLHGIGADRRQMIDRARFLKRQGYSLLLIDLPSHGQSDGDRITFGYRESEAVAAALEFLARAFPGQRQGVIGASLGAASFVLSGTNRAPDAVVLESMFPTLEDAVRDRMRIYLGAGGPLLAPLLLWQLPLRTGISADQIRPVDALPALHAPLFIASGSADRNTTIAETQRIFAAANAPKDLWIVDGAAHQDLYAYDRKAYEARVGAFLARYLQHAGPP